LVSGRVRVESLAFDVYAACRPSAPTITWGRLGFDAGIKVCGACREGSDSRKTIAVTFIVANDENYALAA
jgi:hypothetical protein